MKYKLFIFCPDDQTIIDKIITAASNAGAGIMGNYTHCAFVVKGRGQWKSEEEANPTIGKVGELTRIDEAKIEMECLAQNAEKIKKAISKVHPYEEPGIEFIPMDEI